jgi:hypothetical protein
MTDPAPQQLRRALSDTRKWLDKHFNPPTASEAPFCDLLRRYLRHCERDPNKLSDPARARQSLGRIKRAVLDLTMLRLSRGPRRDESPDAE